MSCSSYANLYAKSGDDDDLGVRFKAGNFPHIIEKYTVDRVSLPLYSVVSCNVLM